MKKVMLAGLMLCLSASMASAQSNYIRLTAKTSPATLPIVVSTKWLTTIKLADDTVDEIFASDTEMLSIDEAKNGNLLIRSKKATGVTDVHIYTASGQVWVIPVQIGSLDQPNTYELTSAARKISNTSSVIPSDVVPTTSLNTVAAATAAASAAKPQPSAVQRMLELRNGATPSAGTTLNTPAKTTPAVSTPAPVPSAPPAAPADLFPASAAPAAPVVSTTNTPSVVTQTTTVSTTTPATITPATNNVVAATTTNVAMTNTQKSVSAPASAIPARVETNFETKTRISPDGTIRVNYTITPGTLAVSFDPQDIQVFVGGEEVDFSLTRVGGAEKRAMMPGQIEEGMITLAKNNTSSDIEIKWVITDDQKRTFSRTYSAAQGK